MNKKMKKIIMIIMGAAIIFLALHLSLNYLLPEIIKMHSGGMY